MAKTITVQRKILKLNSKDIKNYTLVNMTLNNSNENIYKVKWEYNIDIKDISNKDSIVSVGESHKIRVLDYITKSTPKDSTIRKEYSIRKRVIKLKRKGLELPENLISYENKSIKKINEEIFKLQFNPYYIVISFENTKDFDCVVKNGVNINGEDFVRLYGTSAGLKLNSVIFVNAKYHTRLLKMLQNGHKKDIKIVPAKYEGYLSLNSSASTPTTYKFQPNEILVVPDQVIKVNTLATIVRQCIGEEPNISQELYEYGYEQSDGGLVIDYSIAEHWSKDLELDYVFSAAIIRNSFMKGAAGVIPLQEFIQENISHIGKVYDIWELQKPESERKEFDISNLKMIMPASVFKLWYAYDSIEDYLDKCEKNLFNFSITKASPKQLENERTLNYQFIQSLDLTIEDTDKMIQPTIDCFHDILQNDYRKTILYTKGTHLDETSVESTDSDYFKALMVDNRVMDDMFIKKSIYKMLKNAIDKAKIAKIKVQASYETILPDLLLFTEYALNVSGGVGALKKGEFYSKNWVDRKATEVVAMRSPMCTYANYQKLNIISLDGKYTPYGYNISKFFRYINTCVVFNGYDSTAESLSGADKDGDAVFLTNDEYILKGVHNVPPIICPSTSTPKSNITDKLLVESNKKGFNNNVGKATNKASNIRDKMAWFEKDSFEYQVLYQREQAIQRIQQVIIDSVKNSHIEHIPKSWYSASKNKIEDGDTEEIIRQKEFNLTVLADKKPYYFMYIYDEVKKEHDRYKENFNTNCMRYYGVTLDEVLSSDKYFELKKAYYDNMIVNDSPSIMNHICHRFEKEFDGYFTRKENKTEFNYEIYKSGVEYEKSEYNKVVEVFEQYRNALNEYGKKKWRGEEIENREDALNTFRSVFKKEAENACVNEDKLCDIVLDMTYGKKKYHQFAWDVCSDVIVKNLLKLNNNQIVYFEKDINGVVDFGGEKFTMKKKTFNNKE